jgi:hypothetical protein
MKSDRMALVRAPEQLSTALEFGELRSELAQEMCALKLDIVKMKCDLSRSRLAWHGVDDEFADRVTGERDRYSDPVGREIVRLLPSMPAMNGFLAALLVAVLGLGGMLIGKL